MTLKINSLPNEKKSCFKNFKSAFVHELQINNKSEMSESIKKILHYDSKIVKFWRRLLIQKRNLNRMSSLIHSTKVDIVYERATTEGNHGENTNIDK